MANATIAQKFSTSPRNVWNGSEKIPLDVGGADGVGLASTLRDYVGLIFKTKLTADRNYYVATTGNDTTGTGASGVPWASPQKAWDWVVANLDLAGFKVTINCAAGTYSPLVTDQPVLYAHNTPSGGGVIKFIGQTTRTLVRWYNPSTNNGTVIDAGGPFQNIEFHNIQIFERSDQNNYNASAYLYGLNSYYYLNNCDLGPSSAGYVLGWNYAHIDIDGTYSILGGVKSSALRVYGGGVINHYAHADVPAPISVGTTDTTFWAFLHVFGAGSSISIYPGYITGVSNVTGKKYNFGSGGAIYLAAIDTNAVHLSDLPGTIAGSATFSGFVDTDRAGFAGTNQAMYGVTAMVGLPTTTDLEPTTWGLFKNTTDSKVYLAFNDGGTIKKVELT